MHRFSKVLVTGGAGFIGSHLVSRLLNDGLDVVALDNLFTGKLENIKTHLDNSHLHFVKGDMRTRSVLNRSVTQVDCVFHLAAIASVPFSVKDPLLTNDVNVTGTLNLLKACSDSGAKRFVFASSCAVYGEPHCLPLDEKHSTLPISPMAVSKLAAEHYCRIFHETYGLETVILRLFNVYGIRQSLGDEGAVIAKFIERLSNKAPLVIYGDGSQTRDFVHVNDVVEAFVLASQKEKAAGDVFNVGSGTSTTVNDLVKVLQNATGRHLEVKYEKPRLGDIKHSFANIEKAKKTLGYKPKVSLNLGLKTLLKKSC